MVPEPLKIYLYQDLIQMYGVENMLDGNDEDYNLEESVYPRDRFKRQFPTRDSVFIIMHTSGTTNEPKGAMITHKNILSGNAH